jgi:hypothetical protein
LSHAFLHAQRARALIALGDFVEARRSVDAGWKAVEPLSSMQDASGVQTAIGSLWHCEALLRQAAEDWRVQREAWEKCLARRLHVAQLWENNRPCLFNVAGVEAEFADAAERAGDVERAARLRKAAARHREGLVDE